MAIKFLSGLNLSDVTAGSILKLDSSGNIVAAVDGTDYNTGSADSWSATGSDIYRNSDVRIGTYQSSVAPSARLHVFDYQTTDPKLLIEDGNTGDASMQFKISTQSYTMGIDNSDSDKFIIANASGFNLAANTHALEISTAGKVTIPAHTSNGVVRFEVGGYNRLRFNGGIDLLGYTQDHLWVIGNSGTNTINLGGDWDWDKQVAISYQPNTVGNAGGVMILGQTEKNNANWTHGITKLYTNGTERLRVDSSGNVKVYGGDLDLRDPNAEDATNVLYFNANNGASTNDSNDIGTGIVWKPDYTGYSKRSAGIMQIGEGNYFKSGLAFYTNNTSDNSTDWSERMRLDKDGNLGIGVSEPAYKLHVEGNVGITEYLQHKGDNNTYLRFSTDLIRLAAGGVEMIRLLENGTQDAVIINEGGADVDFRVESDTDTHAFFVQGSDGYAGFGTSTPNTQLHVDGTITVTGSSLLRRYVSGWSNATTHDVVYNGWTETLGDYVYLKAQGNSTSGHGMMLVGDNVAYIGRSDVETGAVTGLDQTWATFKNGGVGIGTTSPSEKLHVSGGNILVDAQYGIRFVDGNTRIYTNSDSPEDLIVEADQNLHLNPDGSILAQSNISMEGGSIITTDSSNALVLRSDIQVGQGDEDAIIEFKHGTTSLGKIDQDGYVYAAGFKTSTASTGLLKADGTVDTTTLGTMASADTGDYKDSDTVETYVATELASYTTTSSFGTNAFTSYTDHSTQGYLTASSTDLDSRYYTETELTNFFKSVTHQGNYISTANWSNDGSGTVASGWSAEGFPFNPTASFSANGSSTENTRTVQELPNGAYGVVWRTPSNDADSGADGGWDMDIYNVHHSKAYRSVVYFQKTDDSTSGTFYHGCHGSHTLQMNGSAHTNPYFHNLGFSNLVENRWYVSIGYIQPYQYPTATNSGRSGIYDCYTGKKIHSGTDFMMKSGSTTQRHRTYQYYSTDTNSSINWWNPRFEELNGNEPSIAELIQRVGVDGELGLNFHSKFPAGALDSLTEATDATNDKILLWDESADVWKQMTLEDLQDSIDQNTTYSVATTSANGLMSSSDKTKLDGVATGAEVNVQSDWNATSGDAYIQNKPTLGTASASAATDFVAVSGDTMSGDLNMGSQDIKAVNSIVLNNVEGESFGTVNGTLIFDENFYGDTEYGTAWSGGNGGGLAIYGEDGWNRLLSDKNAQWFLGSAAFSATGDFVSASGDTLSGNLDIVHAVADTGLVVRVSGGAQPTSTAQFKVGRDTSQYWGVRTDDSTAYLIHRQDETGASTHQTRFELHTSATGTASWQWWKHDNAGLNAAQKMKLTDDSELTLGGGSNTITNTKVGNWDTAYGWGNHASAGYLTAHPSISEASDVNNSNGTVIQDLTFDDNGHVTATGSVDLDGRYYTETEADGRFLRMGGGTYTSGGDVHFRLKGTGTGTSDYSEISIDNNANHRLVIGSIGSNYSNDDWAGSRYIYSTSGELRVKAATNLRLFSGGHAYPEDLAVTFDTSQNATFEGDVTVSGTLEATAKSFNIEHPTKEGKRLVYGSLEGAEHGVYFRGKGTGEVIELPDHWTGLVHEDSITVQLTPIGKNCVWVEDIKDNSVHVGMDNDTPYFYFIQAERKDIDKLIVEQDA